MKRIQFYSKLGLDGTIIDFETTHWDARKGEIITAGFLSQSSFTILQRLESTEDKFKKRVVKEMKTKKKPTKRRRPKTPLEKVTKQLEKDFLGS